MLQRLKSHVRKIIGRDSGPDELPGLNPKDREMLTRVQSNNLTYLKTPRLASISKTTRSIVEAKAPGIFLEAGCALGGSSILIASIKEDARPLFVYDVFGMIPPPTKEDTKDVH